MMRRTIVDERYEEGASILSGLLNGGMVSEAQALQDTLRRAFVVGAASYFEQTLKEALSQFVAVKSQNDKGMQALVKLAVVDRGFHQMFQWESKNANKFLSHFGPDLGDVMKRDCGEALKGSVQSFMELGNLRNCIVHQNFHAFYFEKTLEECYASYKDARQFVEYVQESIAPQPAPST